MNASTCLVCGTQGERLCSYECIEAANREQERNAARLQQLNPNDDADDRYRLSQRNGEIAAALIAWRPEPSQNA